MLQPNDIWLALVDLLSCIDEACRVIFYNDAANYPVERRTVCSRRQGIYIHNNVFGCRVKRALDVSGEGGDTTAAWCKPADQSNTNTGQV